MLEIQTQLFEERDIRFGPIDHEAHAGIESKWTHDTEFMRLMEMRPIRPLSPALVKKEYEAIEKKAMESKNMYYFTIRAREDDRLIGKAILQWIDWMNSSGLIQLGLGAEEDRRRGLGTQALRLLLRFAFAELGLHRVSAMSAEYNEGALRLLQKAGFSEEIRRRQAVERDGRHWDLLMFGLLRSEWEAQNKAQG